MTLYLRNDKNHTLLDLECNVVRGENGPYVEVSSVIPIGAYSKFLLANKGREEAIIAAFSQLDELRGWLWESYFASKDNDGSDYDDVLKELRKILDTVARRFNLRVIED